MNKINKSNYEEFMIDYLDGTLSAEREAQLLLFLENNPTIKAELEGLDEMILSEVDMVFECHDCLKKSILDSSLVHDDNFENFCIASIEGDLSELEEEHLKNYLHDYPTKNVIYNQYSLLKLQPSENHIVGEKLSLYHLATQSNEAVNKDNYLDFVIARNEGDLNALQTKNLDLFIQENPQLAKEIQVFEKLKLQADTSIVYKDKASLKRRKIAFALPYAWVNTAAASVAIFLFFYFIIPNKPWGDVKNHDSVSTTDTSIYQGDINIDKPKDQKHYTISEESQHKPKSTKKCTIRKKAIAKNPNMQVREKLVITEVAPKTCEGVAISNTNLSVIEEQRFPIEMLKPVIEVEEKIAEVNQERIYEVNGIAGKIIAKLSKVLAREEKESKNRERSNIKEQIMVVADYAVEGFNRMTEADISLPSRRDKLKE